MRQTEFGFRCGSFSVVLSGNDLLLPGSKNRPLGRSLLPGVRDLNEAAGKYTLTVKVSGKAVCWMPVHVCWAGHQSQQEPFLALKSNDPVELKSALEVYAGEAVELAFTPRK